MRMPRTLRFAVIASPLGSVAAWAAAGTKPGATTPRRAQSTAHPAAGQPLSIAARMADVVAFAKSPGLPTETRREPDHAVHRTRPKVARR